MTGTRVARMRTGSVAPRFSGLSIKDAMRVAFVMRTRRPQRFFITLEALSKCQDAAVQKLVTDPKVITRGLRLWGCKEGTISDLMNRADVHKIDLVTILAAIERHCGKYTSEAVLTLFPRIEHKIMVHGDYSTESLAETYERYGDAARNAKDESEARKFIQCLWPPEAEFHEPQPVGSRHALRHPVYIPQHRRAVYSRPRAAWTFK